MKRIGLMFCRIVGALSAAQAAVSPDRLVQQTTDKVLTQLTENRDALDQDPERLYQMVHEIVLPHFDFKLMSRCVLGQH